MGVILFLGLIAGLVWFWTDSTRTREHVLRHCAALCSQMHVQLLDQTVRLSRLRIARNETGSMCIRRFYDYEFSINGADRWRGSVVLLGTRIEDSRMDHPQGTVVFVNN